MMKFKEVFLLLKMSSKVSLKKNIQEGGKKENLYWLHADGLKLLLTMNHKPPLKKTFNGGFVKGTVCCLYQNKPFNKAHL